ncbi:hypothetical protein LJR164_000865 [Phenylobacterium sp. LjRoot164]|uniref:class II aldolase/adducin family protein n=1 Tax=unclassified Phenylobacterium TaxID=2640670 RepID=UPI003ED0C2BC
MRQTPVGLGLVALSVTLQEFLSGARLEAARAFRVLRDVGHVHPAAELDFILRGPEEGQVVRLGHPGLWSVSLEPKVTVLGLDGQLVAGERAARAPVEEFIDLFRRREDLTAIARFSSPQLDAWARGGRTLPFAHMPLARSSLHQGVQVYRYGSAAAALEPALNNNYAGVVHAQGGAVLAGSSVTQLTELILQVEQAAQVELLSAVWRGDERDEHQAPEARAILSWA